MMMSESNRKPHIHVFTESWLLLREPYDARARNTDVLGAVADTVAHRASMSIVDLGCGIGAALRALSSHLPVNQDWCLVDHNLSALGHVQALALAPRVKLRTMLLDLVSNLQTALDGSIDLITTSAFLDLVSREWLDQLVRRTTARRIPVYAALTYDGRVSLTPINALDAAVIAAVNQHQLGDKGFGPALGPGAAAEAVERFQAAEYQVVHGKSDWTFGPIDRKIQLEIFAGWADAARETGKFPIADLDKWLSARRDAVAQGCSRLRVGHVDFFARPRQTVETKCVNPEQTSGR